jgi:hypothetical protein
MRFGWLTLSLSPSPEEDAVRIYHQIEQVRFAEQLGFGDVWVTQPKRIDASEETAEKPNARRPTNRGSRWRPQIAAHPRR